MTAEIHTEDITTGEYTFTCTPSEEIPASAGTYKWVSDNTDCINFSDEVNGVATVNNGVANVSLYLVLTDGSEHKLAEKEVIVGVVRIIENGTQTYKEVAFTTQNGETWANIDLINSMSIDGGKITVNTSTATNTAGTRYPDIRLMLGDDTLKDNTFYRLSFTLNFTSYTTSSTWVKFRVGAFANANEGVQVPQNIIFESGIVGTTTNIDLVFLTGVNGESGYVNNMIHLLMEHSAGSAENYILEISDISLQEAAGYDESTGEKGNIYAPVYHANDEEYYGKFLPGKEVSFNRGPIFWTDDVNANEETSITYPNWAALSLQWFSDDTSVVNFTDNSEGNNIATLGDVIDSSTIVRLCWVNKATNEVVYTLGTYEVTICYVENRLETFYGVLESMQEDTFQQDPMTSPAETAALTKAMGFGTYSFRMEPMEVVELDANGKPQIIASRAAELNGYLDLLFNEGGVKTIQCHGNWLVRTTALTAEMNANGVAGMAFPRPGSENYLEFMQLTEKVYQLLAETFPRISKWQAASEINTELFCVCSDGGALTQAERAQLATDLMYYINKGTKAGNPNSRYIMPGIALTDSFDDRKQFLEMIYQNIESGNFPVGNTKSTNSDDYFDILSWHPYNWSQAVAPESGEGSAWLTRQIEMYQIAINHGDEGKPVIFSEFGFTVTGAAQTLHNMTRAELEEATRYVLAETMQNVYTYLPWVESVIVFRLYDWNNASTDESLATGSTANEAGFGLFTSPGLTEADAGPAPKPMAIELFYLINGEDADTTPLYQFYTTQ